MAENQRVELSEQQKQFRDMLAGLYFDQDGIRSIVKKAGLSVPDFRGKLIDAWHSILQEALVSEKVQVLARLAMEDSQENELLKSVALGVDLKLANGPSFATVGDEEEILWQGKENTTVLEKIIGDQNNLLPISFLEVGLKKSLSVARIRLPDGALGTGFLTRQNLLVTNHHVLPTEISASQAVVEFNYQKNAVGLPLESHRYKCNPADGFLTSREDDWTVVRLFGEPNKKWLSINLQSNSCKVNDRVLIIQHPAGGFKAIGMHQNLVTSVTESRIQYLTDTMPGSSGSPVFDMAWNLVAVHHSGGWLREPKSKAKLFRNEGIAIDRVLEGASSLVATRPRKTHT